MANDSESPEETGGSQASSESSSASDDTSSSGSAKKSSSKKATTAKQSSGKKKSGTGKKTAAAKTSASRASRESDDSGSDQRSGSSGASGSRSSRKLGAVKIARMAVQQLAGLTGRSPECVVGVERDDDTWIVDVEVVESRRIPDSTDVMATYRVECDEDGELIGYHRSNRYIRGKGDDRD